MKRAIAAVTLALAIAGALIGTAGTASGDASSAAEGSAFGLSLEGPVPIEATPVVEARIPPGTSAEDEDVILEVPADPVATSFTALVKAEAARDSTIEALLQSTIADAAGAALPEGWNGRGYAITEDLEALAGNLTADVVESEAAAACVGGEVALASAARILNLSIGGQDIPVINPDPNQVVFDQGGIKVVFWETNWDPETGGTTDGDATVFANALHVTAPGDVDLVVSHSEASTTCAEDQVGGRRVPRQQVTPPEAPPAAPIERQPAFTG